MAKGQGRGLAMSTAPRYTRAQREVMELPLCRTEGCPRAPDRTGGMCPPCRGSAARGRADARLALRRPDLGASTIDVPLPVELHERARDAARAEELTIGAWVERAVRMALGEPVRWPEVVAMEAELRAAHEASGQSEFRRRTGTLG